MQQAFVPVGYKFQPADTELVAFFLRNQVVHGASTNPPMIYECDLYGAEKPWEVWARFRPKYEQLFHGGVVHGGDLDLYFFTKLKKKDPKHKRVERRVGSGGRTWHRNCAARKVRGHGGEVIGEMKIFIYKNANSVQHDKWIMHEYSLPDCATENVVLCRLRRKPDASVYGAGSINQHSTTTSVVENNYNGVAGGVIRNFPVHDQEYPAADPHNNDNGMGDWSMEILSQLMNEEDSHGHLNNTGLMEDCSMEMVSQLMNEEDSHDYLNNTDPMEDWSMEILSELMNEEDSHGHLNNIDSMEDWSIEMVSQLMNEEDSHDYLNSTGPMEDWSVEMVSQLMNEEDSHDYLNNTGPMKDWSMEMSSQLINE